MAGSLLLVVVVVLKTRTETQNFWSCIRERKGVVAISDNNNKTPSVRGDAYRMLIGSWKSNPTSSGYVVSENIDTFHSHLGVLKRAIPLSPLNERTNEWMNEFHTFHSQFGLFFSTQSDETHHLLIISTHFHSHLSRLKAPSDSFLEWLFLPSLIGTFKPM
jgi:hypothetical protein